jgi:predicted phage terminase large subunit-like protein
VGRRVRIRLTAPLLRRRWRVLDVHRAKHDFPALKTNALLAARRWRPEAILIEAAGTGHALCSELRLANSLSSCNVTAITPREAKAVRLEAQTEALSQGLIMLPANAPWIGDLRNELLGFPNSKHDDQVDALVQFVSWIRRRGSAALETAKYGRRLGVDRR